MADNLVRLHDEIILFISSLTLLYIYTFFRNFRVNAILFVFTMSSRYDDKKKKKRD